MDRRSSALRDTLGRIDTARGRLSPLRAGKVRLSASGVHWFDRASGLNILFDDVPIPAAQWHRAPRYVSIALTNACELRCPFCYAPKTPARLDAELVLRWLIELDSAGCLGVGFGGGEPTAHPEFARLCHLAAERTGLAVTFTTHGHRATRELADDVRGSVNFIRVSMDGTGAVYELLRGRSFDRFCRQLDVIASIAPFGLNVVVNAQTVEVLDDITTFASQAGAAELLLLPEQPVGMRPGIDATTAARLTAWINAGPKSVRLAISQAGAHDGMPLADPYGSEPALDAHMHVTAQGVLMPHAFCSKGVPIATSVLLACDQLRAQAALS